MTETRPRLVLAICCMSLFIVGMDNTIVNIALPAIRTDLDASVSSLQWTIDAYTLVIASLLMLGGSTGDRLGRARIFTSGLVLFSIGSLACSVAPSIGALIAARVVQAAGGSMLNPVALSIVRATFDDAADRARALGMWAGVFGLSFAAGPVLGGALVDAIGWRSIFWVNVPVGLAAIVLTRRFVPESRADRPRRVDPGGQALVLIALATVTFAIIEGGRSGWGEPPVIACLAAAAIATAVLIPYERRRPEPLLQISAFRSAPFSGAALTAIIAFGGFAGFLFLSTLYLQGTRGLSALEAGLCLLPAAGAIIVGGPLSGRIVARVGPRPCLVLGGICQLSGGLMLTGLAPHTQLAWLLLTFFVFGVGFGMVNPPITNAAVAGLPAAQAGVAAAVASTSRQVGATLGVAVLGSIAVASSGSPVHLADATHTGWWVIAGTGVAIVALGLVTTSRRAVASAHAVAAP